MEEQNIPIDINTNKLLDWLISRRHVNKDWQNNILKVREQINHAIQDMPAHDGILNLLSGQHINYFHCLKIVEILKETEADTKNLFGRYGSQRMKDWQDIVSAYQKDNLYLADAAQVLIRNVTYEIPSLRKYVSKLEQNQVEYEKKIKDYSKTESMALKEFNTACEQLGISGKNIKNELLELVKELPKIFEETAEKIKIVKPAIELYSEFNKYLSGKNSDGNILAHLKYLVESGNTTTYQYRYDAPPTVIYEFKPEPSSSESENSNEIDFGDNGDEINFGDTSAEINFDINLDNAIDFDITTSEEHNGNSSSSNPEEEFEMVTHDDLHHHFEESGIVVEHTGPESGIAKGEEALTVLDNPKLQEQIINDLMELSAFLKMRLHEISSDSNLLNVSQMQDAPTILQMQTIESISTLNDCINVALDQLTNKRIQHLHNIKHSPKYVDILTATLKQKLSVVEKMRANKTLLEEKIKSSRDEVRRTEPLIKLAVNSTKQLQKEIQQDISKKYKGRVVNLIGVSNVL